MVDYSEVRCLSPSVLFFLASLGASFRSSSGCCPQIEGFALRDNNLGLILTNLYHFFASILELVSIFARDVHGRKGGDVDTRGLWSHHLVFAMV